MLRTGPGFQDCGDYPALDDLPDLYHQVGGKRPCSPFQHRTEWSWAAAELRAWWQRKDRGGDASRAALDRPGSHNRIIKFLQDSWLEEESITFGPGSLCLPQPCSGVELFLPHPLQEPPRLGIKRRLNYHCRQIPEAAGVKRKRQGLSVLGIHPGIVFYSAFGAPPGISAAG